MTQQVPLHRALENYQPTYDKLFEPGNFLKKDEKKGWIISRSPVPTSKQTKYLSDLLYDLIRENFNQLPDPQPLIIRLNERFVKPVVPRSLPNTILFKSSSKEFSFLSNFFPTLIVHNNCLFRSSEHLYQWRVVIALKEDEEAEAFRKVRDMTDPLKARNYAHEVKKEVKRDIAPEEKCAIMSEVTHLKYSQNPQLRAALLSTGEVHLREDTESLFWGGEENQMGKILMAARSTFL